MQISVIKWQEQFNIGVELIDDAHRQLFSIIRKIMHFIEDEKNEFACIEGIKFFKSYAVRHFAEEEAYMRSIGYPGLGMHKRLHDNLRDKTLPMLETMLMEEEYSPQAVQRFLGICVGWLTGHILVEDRAITGKVASKYRDQIQGDLFALKAAIPSVMQELVSGTVQVVSDHYAGEDIGKTFCYEMIYTSLDDPENKLRILLILEESLILRLAGEMLDISFQKVGEIVRGATTQIAQALTQRVSACILPLDADYYLEQDHFLPPLQVEDVFANSYPQYSLLFSTSWGCFAFCLDK